jgi:hypothetical protein
LLVAQVVAQAPASHVYGVQSTPPACGPHVPVPLHVCDLATVPAHVGVPQTVPEAQIWQAPAPSQAPSVPQVDWACIAHWLLGSFPAATLPHRPSAPLPFLAAVHAWQVPVQALLQHTPSAQKPDWHVAPDVHELPFACEAVQAPPLQVYPEMHWAFELHGVVQAPDAQV